MAFQSASSESIASAIGGWARELGFQQVGITGVDLADQEPHVRRWLRRGFNGEMGYLARNVEKRLHPPALEAETCTVISARMNYLPTGTAPIETLAAPERAYIARYALGRDYHKLMRRRLAKLAHRIDAAAQSVNARFRAFTDSAPVLEKALGERAGLGWIGKHTLLIHPDAGSWFFIGEIYTNLSLPGTGTVEEDRCGRCKACMTVCPTGAIVGPKQLDARRCISYLTIEHRSSIPEALRPLMGNRIFGCDDCQLYCPWNRQAETTAEQAFLPRVVAVDKPGRGPENPAGSASEAPEEALGAARLDQATLLELFAWDEASFLRHSEGSPLRRIGYERWQRNLAVALGNGPPSPKVMRALRERLAGASSMVREHLEWALARLSAKTGTRCKGDGGQKGDGDSGAKPCSRQ